MKDSFGVVYSTLDEEDALQLKDQVFNVFDDFEWNTYLRGVMNWFEEIWKRMRQASESEVQRRKRGRGRPQISDLVYNYYVPRMRRTKLGVKWEGPFPVDGKASATTFMVNGKLENA